MNNGDDIHNLLKTLGHDAGIYQDLAKYNASRAAVRRAAMGRPTDPAAAAVVASVPAVPAVPPSASEVPRVLRLGPEAHTGPSSLSSILNRLASPSDPAPTHGSGHGPTPVRTPSAAPTPQPTRLDRLFGRLASRTPGPLGR
ncbi:hypothetical protein [Sphaerotilus sp.]|jgi:hypothetical protein|uniref:hypothetical protein n=1 Tax=Sphaerotilus sp. TaxID=2093942 RepID=UPI00286DED54|nr:hypothetical protein [Sphaerotilus sp.]